MPSTIEPTPHAQHTRHIPAAPHTQPSRPPTTPFVRGHSTVPSHPAAELARFQDVGTPVPSASRFRPILWMTALVLIALAAGPTAIGYSQPAGQPRDAEDQQGVVQDAHTEYGFPVVPGRVSRAFDGPTQPWLPGHRGVDLVASPGQSVLAAAAGRVVFSGMVAGRPVVSIDHIDGIRTTYEPVASAVREGQEVGAGALIGRVSGLHEGCAAQACVHWGARVGGEEDAYVDPLSLLGARFRPVVLKPL